MIDPAAREICFNDYLRTGRRFPPVRGTARKVNAWARSMSLIAEQFADEQPSEVERFIQQQRASK